MIMPIGWIWLSMPWKQQLISPIMPCQQASLLEALQARLSRLHTRELRIPYPPWQKKGLSTGSVIEGVIKGGTEAATTLMDSGIAKAGVTIGGTVAGEVAGAVNDGTDIGDAIKDGLISGSGNAAIGAVGDAIGEAVEGGGLLNKAAETAGKIAETAYGKEIVDPMLDKLANKDDQ